MSEPHTVSNPPRVVKPEGPEAQYVIWYVPNFPLVKLKYTPLEDTTQETPRRLMLAKDIDERGLMNPLLVWNHTPVTQRDYPRPYYLQLGYNKLWALKYLKRPNAPAFLTMDVGHAPEFPCRGIYRNDDVLRFWKDGDFVWAPVGITAKNCARLDYYEIPA